MSIQSALTSTFAQQGIGLAAMGGEDSGQGVGNPLEAIDGEPEEEIDPNSLVDGWEHDPIKMEIKFACSVLNWKAHLPKLKKDVLKVYAFYKQATTGDAPPPEEKPFDTLGREKWEVWDKWRGTPSEVAKRRYITYLRDIDENLVYVAVNEKPPYGFPKTRYKESICARCNSGAGCLRELLDEEGKPLRNQILGENIDPSLFEYENLKGWFEKYENRQKCKWGVHCPLSDAQARPFKEWYDRPDVMGFKPFKKGKLVPLLKEVLHKQLEVLYACQVDYKDKSDLKNKKLLHAAHQRLNQQTDRVLGMQYYHREITGEEYTFEVPCLRTSKHCNTRRSAASGMNHTHPLEIIRPSVDYTYYERAVALRQEARRLGMSAQTGLVESSEERASILASRIAEFHARQAKMMEAKRNLLYQEWRHPTQKEDVVNFSEAYVQGQLENAILSVDCERMATLVARGAPPNFETKTGLTALIQCVLQSNREAMRKLVKSGSDINYFNKNGMNALMWACKKDSLIMVHEVLDNEAAPGLEGPTGLTACMIAVRNGNKSALEVVCDHVLRHDEAKQLAVDRILNHRSLLKGKTALMICAHHRMWAMCRMLCRLGADTNTADFSGYSAARIAQNAGWTDLGEWLQKTRAIGPNGITTYSDSTNEKKERVATGKLKKAIESGETVTGEEAFKLGLAIITGERINSRSTTPSKSSRGTSRRFGSPANSDSSGGSPSSSRASSPMEKGRPSRSGSPQNGRRRSTRARKGSRVGSPGRSRSPSTRGTRVGSPNPISEHEDVGVASLSFDPSMFAEGSMVEVNGTLVEPLMEVPIYLKVIAEGKANPDTEIAAGTTALIRASFEGNLRVVKLLVENGCDVNFDNKTGQTPLMSAAAGGSLEVAKYLLMLKAKLNIKDIAGMNATAYANNNNNKEMLDFLMSSRLRGAEDAIRRMENPDEDEAKEDALAEGERAQQALLMKYGATPTGVDDGDHDSWRWRLPGMVNRENVHEIEPSSSDDSDEEERKRKGIGDKGVVKVRCCKCTLFLPCKHYKTFHDMWQKNPDGVGYKWGLRAKTEKKKKWGGSRGSSRSRRGSKAGFDWRTTKDAKDEVEVARKDHEKRMRAAFDSMDVNKDGDLTKQEIKAAVCFNAEVREILQIPDTASDEFDDLYSKIDLDKSESITFEEFHTYFAKKKDDLQQEKKKKAKEEHFVKKLEGAYKLVDLNGDGDVSKAEMLMAIQSNCKIQEMIGIKNGGVSAEEFEKIYSKIDSDGSDFIDFEEFKLFFVKKRIEDMDAEEKTELSQRKAFNLMDVDQSGTLNKTEILMAVKENVRIQSLMGVGGGVSSTDFDELYKIIDADGSREVDFEEFQDFFKKKAQEDRKREMKKNGSRSGSRGGDESDAESTGGRTPKGYGVKKRKKKKTTFSPTNTLAIEKRDAPKRQPGQRHSFFNELGKKKKKKKGRFDDKFDDGKPRDRYGWQGEIGELEKEESRIQAERKKVAFVGLNCDFSGKRYVAERCMVCSVGFSKVKMMPEELHLCDRCLLERFLETRSFCRLVAVEPKLIRAKPKRKGEELEVFNEPDEIQLVSFYIGQKRYDDAERMIKVLLEKQSDVLENGGADDVAMAFTLRALGGFEEARGRIPLARAHRENSMDVFAAALGPTHKQTLYAVELYAETLKKQGSWFFAVEFYNGIYMQFRDSKIEERRKMAVNMKIKCQECVERRENELMVKEDKRSAKLRERYNPKPKVSKQHSLRHLNGFSEEKKSEGIVVEMSFMEDMLVSDKYWDMVGTRDFRKTCKLVGCFNLLRFWLSVMEFRGMRPNEAGFSHTSRRIYREFVLEKDILEFVDNETRAWLGDILETEKRAPPMDMYDELFQKCTLDLYEKGFLNFVNTELGRRWFKDHCLMQYEAFAVLNLQAKLRMIIVKRAITICAWLELTLRQYYQEKWAGDVKKFKMFVAERKRIRGLADEIGSTIKEYLEKFASLSPEKFKKWKEGKLMRMREARSLRRSIGRKGDEKKKKKKKEIVGAFETQFTVHRCRGLKKADMFGKSDPCVLLKWLPGGIGEKPIEVGRTSVISSNLNPDWGKWKLNSVWIEGMINDKGEKEPNPGQFTLEVFDMDMKIKLGDFLGQTVVDSTIACDQEQYIIKEERELKWRPGGAKANKCVQGSIIFSCKSKWKLNARKDTPLTMACSGKDGDVKAGEGGKGGMFSGIKMPSINLKVPEVPQLLGKKVRVVKPHFKLKLTVHRCKGLAKADMFGKSDPCVLVYYQGKRIAKSPVVSKTLDPEWGRTTDRGVVGGHLFDPPVKIWSEEDGKLKEEEKDEKVGVEVYDCDAGVPSEFLGCVSFRVGRLLGMKGTKEAEFQLQQKEGAKKKSKKVKGTIYLSVDTEFEKGGEVEEDTMLQGMLGKGLNMMGKAANEEEAAELKRQETNFSVVKLPH